MSGVLLNKMKKKLFVCEVIILTLLQEQHRLITSFLRYDTSFFGELFSGFTIFQCSKIHKKLNYAPKWGNVNMSSFLCYKTVSQTALIQSCFMYKKWFSVFLKTFSSFFRYDSHILRDVFSNFL